MSRVFKENDERTPLLQDSDQVVDSSTARGVATRSLALETEEDDAIAQYSSTTSSSKTPAKASGATQVPASWLTLPKKRQLALLALCRFVEPVSQTSLLSYLYYFLYSLDLTLTPAALSRQAGYLASAFAICMFLTGWFWGWVADRIGRKKVLLTGLLFTAVGSLILAFSDTYRGLVIGRCLAGLMDANIAILRTMILETVVDKKYHSRAFLIPPMAFNFGTVLGPMLGGFLADPTSEKSPASKIFGPGTFFGGENGVAWMQRWRYALPSVVSAILLSTVAGICFLFLEETLETRKKGMDPGTFIGEGLKSFLRRLRYGRANDTSVEVANISSTTTLTTNSSEESNISQQLSGGTAKPIFPTKIWTRNVKLTILSCAILPLHMSTFMPLWGIFLSVPRSPNKEHQHLPFQFNGGLGLSPASIGLATSLFGILGIATQILAYPPVAQRMGILHVYRWSLFAFPLAYFLLPYLSILPSTVPPPGAAAGPAIWIGIATILLLQVAARTFALPSSVILLTNSAPSPLVLGRIHGVAVSLTSLSKAIGLAVAGVLFGVGLKIGAVGTAWWALAGAAIVGAVVGLWLREDEGMSDVERDENRDLHGLCNLCYVTLRYQRCPRTWETKIQIYI